MQYLAIFAAVVLVACTVTPVAIKNEESESPASPAREIHEPKDQKDQKDQKEPLPGKTSVKPKPPVPQPCTDINTGDLKEDIKQKLDCLSKHT
jgi:hypothetical protein